MNMQKKHWNVLVFPGGMENGIEIYNSLKYCKEISLFSASSPVPNQAFYLYRENAVVRDVREDGWIDDLNRVIERNAIDLVYPANSFIIDALNAKRRELGAPALLPEPEILERTRSKKKTIECLKDSLPVPQTYASAGEIRAFPVFAKPDNGYGAQGTVLLEKEEDARKIDFSSCVVQEFLPGREYTVDCFSDRDGRLLFSSGRERSRIRMATSMHAEKVGDELDALFADYARKILSRIKIQGAWFFQMKEDVSGVLKLLEIDVRIAGTMCYDRCKGVNFPLLSIYQFFGLPVSLSINTADLSLDRCLRNRYILHFDYDRVYVDLDDTLIFRGRINTDLIRFLYQCRNNGVKIILLSKNTEKDREAYLRRYRISELFDEKIWLEESAVKAAYIIPEKSIYIDDSFSQRKEAADKLGIPTFDASMIECLSDERI